jgi:hypothetical protein
MKRIRQRLSYSNVTATIALVLALTGVAYASVGLNSVFSRHIAPNAAKGRDIKESSLGPVPGAKGVIHPSHGPIPTEQLVDAIGIGMTMGRINGLGNNVADVYANPVGTSTATTAEANHLMGTNLFGYDVGQLRVQLLTGTMPASTSRTFSIRTGNTPASMGDRVSCEMDAGDSQCSVEGEVALGGLNDMVSIGIATTGTPGSQTFVFGYSFSQQ